MLMEITPCFEPKKDPTVDNGAEMPNHRTTMRARVPVKVESSSQEQEHDDEEVTRQKEPLQMTPRQSGTDREGIP